MPFAVINVDPNIKPLSIPLAFVMVTVLSAVKLVNWPPLVPAKILLIWEAVAVTNTPSNFNPAVNPSCPVISNVVTDSILGCAAVCKVPVNCEAVNLLILIISPDESSTTAFPAEAVPGTDPSK